VKQLAFVLSFACLGLACSGKDPCDALVQEICRGGAISCDAAAAWLAREMVGPRQEPPSAGERAHGCRMLLDDRDALTGYREKAGSDLAGR
jgi:hypothetical protein